MKLTFLLLTTLLLSLNCFAQRTIDLELKPSILTTVGAQAAAQYLKPYTQVVYNGKIKYQYTLRVINHGPDTLRNSDVLIFKTGWGHSFQYTIQNADTLGIPGNSVGIIATVLNSDGSIQWTFAPPPDVPIPFVDTINWCDSIGIVSGAGNSTIADLDLTNNYHCKLVNRRVDDSNYTLLNDDDITLNPGIRAKKLIITFRVPLTDIATITFRDRAGNEVYTQSLGDLTGTTSQTIDISHLPTRPFRAEILYKGQVVVKKLSFK